MPSAPPPFPRQERRWKVTGTARVCEQHVLLQVREVAITTLAPPIAPCSRMSRHGQAHPSASGRVESRQDAAAGVGGLWTNAYRAQGAHVSHSSTTIAAGSTRQGGRSSSSAAGDPATNPYTHVVRRAAWRTVGAARSRQYVSADRCSSTPASNGSARATALRVLMRPLGIYHGLQPTGSGR